VRAPAIRELEFALENLAYDEGLLRDRVVSLEADAAIYRELAQLAIHKLAAATARIASLRSQLQALRDARGLPPADTATEDAA